MKFVKDKWFSRYPISDKFAHYFAEFSVYHILMLHGLEIGWTIFACIIGGLLVEIVQGFIKNGFSWKDFVLDNLGWGSAWLTLVESPWKYLGWFIFAFVYIYFEWLPKKVMRL